MGRGATVCLVIFLMDSSSPGHSFVFDFLHGFFHHGEMGYGRCQVAAARACRVEFAACSSFSSSLPICVMCDTVSSIVAIQDRFMGLRTI
ncbi:hypothetical protein CC79DRAFT_185636 [Sarocladium strictum]